MHALSASGAANEGTDRPRRDSEWHAVEHGVVWPHLVAEPHVAQRERPMFDCVSVEATGGRDVRLEVD